MGSLVLADVPVLHKGYVEFAHRWAGKMDGFGVMHPEIIAELSCTSTSEIRALAPHHAVRFIDSLGIFKYVAIVMLTDLERLKSCSLVLPNDEVSRALAKKHLSGAEIQFDDVFLRWDAASVFSQKPTRYHRVSTDPFDREMIAEAGKEAEKSSDWWRQVGAVLVKDGTVLLKAHNRHVPSEHTPYAVGDPRDFIKAGDQPEISSTLHAEEGITCEAARKGIALESTHLYATLFPCAKCAKYIAYSGIKKCFFAGGSASLDGADVLEARGVELVLVE